MTLGKKEREKNTERTSQRRGKAVMRKLTVNLKKEGNKRYCTTNGQFPLV
jgi:hypothetical protein